MKIAVLSLGALLQLASLYIAFYSGLPGSIYLATLISIAGMFCILVVRYLAAPVILMAGVLIGLSLSHNESDLKTLSLLETQALALLQSGNQGSRQYHETETEITQINVPSLDTTPTVRDERLVAAASN